MYANHVNELEEKDDDEVLSPLQKELVEIERMKLKADPKYMLVWEKVRKTLNLG